MMGRGKDKTISANDIRDMSPAERAALGNLAQMGQVRVKGTAVVRGADGNAKYEDPSQAGKYNEDSLS